MSRKNIYLLVARIDLWLQRYASSAIAFLMAAGCAVGSYFARRECSLAAALGTFAAIFALIGWYGMGNPKNGHAER